MMLGDRCLLTDVGGTTGDESRRILDDWQPINWRESLEKVQ